MEASSSLGNHLGNEVIGKENERERMREGMGRDRDEDRERGRIETRSFGRPHGQERVRRREGEVIEASGDSDRNEVGGGKWAGLGRRA